MQFPDPNPDPDPDPNPNPNPNHCRVPDLEAYSKGLEAAIRTLGEQASASESLNASAISELQQKVLNAKHSAGLREIGLIMRHLFKGELARRVGVWRIGTQLRKDERRTAKVLLLEDTKRMLLNAYQASPSFRLRTSP